MAIDKLTPRYLNFEDDERLVKRVEMIDAQNVRIDADTDGDAGVIKNVKGNVQVDFKNATTDALASGDNKVIGSVRNNVKGEVIFFVWNQNQNHKIYKYDDYQETVEVVFANVASADVLNFSETDFVDASIVVDKNGDSILYFTNGIGEPKKLNVDRALRGDYPDGYESEEAYISLIKKPPAEAPTFTFISNTDLSANRMIGKQFQFACQYIYEDGEVSAISPISKVTKPYSHIQVGLISELEYRRVDNEVEIFCKRINSDIKKVRFLAREGNSGVFFVVKDINTSPSTTDQTVSTKFSNDKAFSPISNDENNKQFDAVGEDVRTLCISGNRIFLGNYTEGFDLPNLDGVSLKANYHNKLEIVNISHPEDSSANFINRSMFNGFYIQGSVSTGDDNSTLPEQGQISHHTYIDFSNLSGANYNSLASFTFTFSLSGVKAHYGDQNGKFKFFFSSTHPEYPNGIALQLNNGVRHRLTDISDTVTIPLDAGTYNSSTEVIDDIALKINQLAPYTVQGEMSAGESARNTPSGGWAPENYNVRSEVEVKLRAGRGFTNNLSNMSAAQKTALEGDEKIVLFFEPRKAIASSHEIYDIANGQDVPFPAQTFYFDSYATEFDTNSSDYGTFGLGWMKEVQRNAATFPIAIPDHCVFQSGSLYMFGFFDSMDEKVSSFKAGANHAFGIAYQDKNGRISTVQPVDNVSVDWFDEREGKGRTSVVMRIPNDIKAPENAARWMPVYTGNTTVGNFLQYTVNDAFIPNATGNAGVPSVSGVDEKLYISARGFEGKENSYVDNNNPRISYSHASGDIMKVVSVDEGRTYSKEFRVLDYVNLTSENNPLGDDLDATANKAEAFEKTGYFFVIKTDSNEFEFISEGESATGNAWKNKCLVEVRTPKYESDNKVYYQVGESYPVSASRVHEGFDRASALASPTVSGADGVYKIVTSTRAYVGDVFNVSIFTGGYAEFVVTNVVYENGSYTLTGTSVALDSVQGNNIASITLTAASQNENVIELDNGDVYFRKRILNYGYKDGSDNKFLTYTDFIEDYRLNDFIPIVANDFGKPNAFSEDAARVDRKASLTYSDAFLLDSGRLSLSSFNNSLANFLDIKNKYGGIQRLIDIEDAFYAVQEHKVSVYPVSRNVIQSAAGDASITLSTDVVNVNSSKSFAGDYGCGNSPESVMYYDGVLYFTDRKSNKVFSISSSGIKEISDIFADSFISDKLDKADKGGQYNLYSGLDPENDEYIFSVRSVFRKAITIGADPTLYRIPANSDDTAKSGLTPSFKKATEFGRFDNLDFRFGSATADVPASAQIDVEFSNLGNGVLYVDDAFADNAMQLEKNIHDQSTGTSTIVYTNKNSTFFGVASVDNSNKTVTLDS